MPPIAQRLGSRVRAWQLVRILRDIRSRRVLGVFVFVTVLRLAWAARKEARLVHDLDKIGRCVVGQDTVDEKVYDVIIVGGGTAGCVLASRLSEDPRRRVLLLEAGQSGVARLYSRIPLLFTLMFHGKHDWDLYTTPQPGCNGRKLYWPRGKMLGGSSSMNAMMFHAGAPSDYAEWARAAGDEGWSYEGLRSYWRRFERHTPNHSHPLVERGTTGLLATGHRRWSSPLTDAFVKACADIGIPASEDVNTPKGSMGATKIMTYMSPTGERSSTESAYLTPDVLARPNLTVAVGMRVLKILLENNPGGEPSAVGVEFTSDRQRGAGPIYRARAHSEVVACAGAVNTPHLLQLSGIGPAKHLAEHGVPVLVDAPGVGSSLEDHATVITLWRDRTGNSLNYMNRNGVWDLVRQVWGLGRWLLTGDGPFGSNVSEAAAFARATDVSLCPPGESEEALADETSAPDAPDLELIFTPLGYTEHTKGPVPPGDLVGIQSILLRPQSQGAVRLHSSDAFTPPAIDPGYLRTENDMRMLVRGVRLALRVGAALARAGVVSDAPEPGLDGDLHLRSDAEIVEVIRGRLETLYHPACTTRMGPRADGAVVDGRLRVYGVKGLRIADAGVMPRLVAGHTAAPCILIAEKCAEMMNEDLPKSNIQTIV